MRASVIRVPRNTATMQSFHQAVRKHDKSSLSPIDRDHLGERLRAMYGQLREEPLPPRLQDLVQQLAPTSPDESLTVQPSSGPEDATGSDAFWSTKKPREGFRRGLS